ncbi:MAG TPA: MFS transporter [Caulobacteraceae bacterium]|nr:MFS transporter [Caulobacteraceae bacterium]
MSEEALEAPAAAVDAPRRYRLLDIVRELGRPRVALMLALGLSSGLPFALIGNTLGFWLHERKVGVALIGLISAVGFAYTVKFVWGAIVDRIKAPLIGRLGRRRSWMIISQVVVAAGLLGMAMIDPMLRLGWFVLAAAVTAIGAATQDTAIDAWRIETAEDANELGLLTSAYSLGYRVALILTEAVILLVAKRIGWPLSYAIYGAAMVIGLAAALAIREPARAEAVMEEKASEAARHPLIGVYDAVIGPLIAFFRAHGLGMAALMLAMISLYHLCDYMRGPMTGPYYEALKIDNDTIGLVRLFVGTPGSFVGIALGGFCAYRFGRLPTLIVGAIAQPLAIGAFAVLGWHGGDFALLSLGAAKVTAFEAIMAFDAVAIGFSGVALVTYMSSLTSLGYTATQYALLTSALAFLGKTAKSLSGFIVEALEPGRSLLDAYALFYVASAAVAVPAIVLCFVLLWVRPARTRV